MLFANGGLLILNLFPHCAHHHLVQSSPHCCDSAGPGRAMIRWHIFMAPTLDPQHIPYKYSTSMVQTQIQNSAWNILVLKIFQVDRHPTACQCSALECLAVYFGAFDRPAWGAWGVLPSWPVHCIHPNLPRMIVIMMFSITLMLRSSSTFCSLQFEDEFSWMVQKYWKRI